MRGDIFMMRTAKACTTVNNGAGGTEISGGRCLRRDLGRLESYATLIGGLIGSGIFVVIGQAGGLAGPSVPLAYVALFPVVMATAMAYMVFMSTPLGERPGGAYVHISRTFGRFFPGFIAVWLQLVAYSGALGVLSLSLGEYMLFFFPNLLRSIRLPRYCFFSIWSILSV